MDFRSQLSAFKNNRGGASSGGGGNNRGGSDNPDDRRRHHHHDDGNNNYDNPHHQGGGYQQQQYQNNNDYYGRGYGGGDGGGYQQDRRRPRPDDGYSPQRGGGGGSYYGHGDPSMEGPPHQRRRHHSPVPDPSRGVDGLEGLRRFGYKLPETLPEPPADLPKAKHICLMAITIDELPYEHIWRAWMDTIPDGADLWVSLVCHAKYPDKIQSEFLKRHLITYPPRVGRGNNYLDPEYLTRKPEWGSVEITRAMIDLLGNALKVGIDEEKDERFTRNRFVAKRPSSSVGSNDDTPSEIPPVDQFLFISETCLPVTTAPRMFELLADTSVSWVNARHRRDPGTPKNLYETDQFALINRRIPGQYRWKGDQWVVLCRHHAQLVWNIDRPHTSAKYQLWQSFRDINASDEMYFPTCLSLLGFLRYDNYKASADPNASQEAPVAVEVKPSVDDHKYIQKRPVTYTDWTEGMRNPATFAKGLPDFQRVAKLAREKGCLAARKFAFFIAVPGTRLEDHKITGQLSAEEWKETVEALEKEELAKTDEGKAEVKPAAPDKQKTES